ncbi:MAG: GAF domain-containing SpoIIE family protein phosphatase [Chloroflexota bacterium]
MSNLSSSGKQRIAELTTLNALAQTLNRAIDLRAALDGALGHIVELMELRTGWIFLREDGLFRLAARHELPPAIDYPGPAWIDTCSCQELCESGRLHKAVNTVRCSRLRHAIGDKRGLAQHASVPLYSGEEIIGILNVATTQFGNFTAAQLQLLSAIGHVVGTAISRARLYEQVKIRRVQEQAVLLQLSQDLLGSSSLEPALQRLVRVGARLLEAEACAFIEADEQGGNAVLLAAHGWRFLPHTGLPTTLDQGNPHLWYLPEVSTRLHDDALYDLPALLAAQEFQGHLAHNVIISDVPVGTLMVNTRTERQFGDDEVQLLGLLGSQLAQSLERERLHRDAMLAQRLEQELDLAREIQSSFLPRFCPIVPGYSIATFYRAARQVGGDFYDFITLETQADCDPTTGTSSTLTHQAPEGERFSSEQSTSRLGRHHDQEPSTESPTRLGIVIADVTDKGVPAALFMALSRTLIRATASEGRPPHLVLEQSNRLILADSRSSLFVTCFYAILEAQTGLLTYADGGHNYPLLYRAATGNVEQLQALGIVLGIMPDPQFEYKSVILEPGDVLCFYTDGVTEAMNARRQLFDEQRLIEVLRRSHHLPPEQIINRVIDAVTNFAAGAPQGDDITLIVLKRDPN